MLKFWNVNITFTLVLLALLGLSFLVTIPGWCFGLTLLVWLVITLIGIFYIRMNYFIKALHANPSKKSATAITFDDGPHPEYTLRILDILKEYNAKATFFCIGSKAEKYPEIIKAINQDGHTLANHTYSHSKWIDFYGADRFEREISRTNDILRTITGKRIMLFRPPYGVTNPHIKKALSKTNHRVIGWNIRSFDTLFNKADTILKRIKKKLSGGDIVLLHDTNPNTVVVLEQLLKHLKRQHIITVTVDSLLNIEAYEK